MSFEGTRADDIPAGDVRRRRPLRGYTADEEAVKALWNEAIRLVQANAAHMSPRGLEHSITVVAPSNDKAFSEQIQFKTVADYLQTPSLRKRISALTMRVSSHYSPPAGSTSSGERRAITVRIQETVGIETIVEGPEHWRPFADQAMNGLVIDALKSPTWPRLESLFTLSILCIGVPGLLLSLYKLSIVEGLILPLWGLFMLALVDPVQRWHPNARIYRGKPEDTVPGYVRRAAGFFWFVLGSYVAGVLAAYFVVAHPLLP